MNILGRLIVSCYDDFEESDNEPMILPGSLSLPDLKRSKNVSQRVVFYV